MESEQIDTVRIDFCTLRCRERNSFEKRSNALIQRFGTASVNECLQPRHCHGIPLRRILGRSYLVHQLLASKALDQFFYRGSSRRTSSLPLGLVELQTVRESAERERPGDLLQNLVLFGLLFLRIERQSEPEIIEQVH